MPSSARRRATHDRGRTRRGARSGRSVDRAPESGRRARVASPVIRSTTNSLPDRRDRGEPGVAVDRVGDDPAAGLAHALPARPLLRRELLGRPSRRTGRRVHDEPLAAALDVEHPQRRLRIVACRASAGTRLRLPSAATSKLRGAPSVKSRVRAFCRGNESVMVLAFCAVGRGRGAPGRRSRQYRRRAKSRARVR